ncbi:MFS transporter [Halorubrum lacusprofundi]|uniref:Major facilitator superfamily MFS_1 n=1 Tax=Halorubrum lacusprofundi (strain ATCC 49239 / DSM 5036 / JCM 8891 / ACAM 34) TaxID=416348 RepID=B9LU28_HALLT|nr:MFS transporter [Halorubrum lacusprofundi]ACM58222.1 major facilitator superfamily MFS_1 [Halorubrum lacusprofundi ATCC 49239]MCG1006305.1 MFS transporter [Halorubrum lacusprofundi]
MTHPEAGAASIEGDDPPRSPAVANPRRALAVVIGVVFIDLVGFGIVIPILPFYVRSFGVSDAFIGLLAASYSLAQFLAAPTLGRLSDRIGRRPVLLASLATAGVAWVTFGYAGESGARFGTAAALATLFASRTLAGAMGGNIAAAQAYVADITPRDRRAGALGLVGASFALGFVFGPAIGGLLAADAVVARADALLPAFVPATAYSLPSFAAAGMSFLAVGVGFVFLEEPKRTRPTEEVEGRHTTAIGQFRNALSSVTLRPLTVAYFVVAVAFAGVQVMFIPYVADAFGYDATAAAFLLTYVGVLGAVNQGVLVGRLSRVVPSRTLVAAGSVILAGALVAIPATGLVDRAAGDVALGGPAWLTLPLVALLIALAALSLGNALVNVSLATLVSASAGDAEQGAAFGVTQGASSLGRTVGPPLMAVLYTVAVASPFLVGALLLVPVAAAFGRRTG